MGEGAHRADEGSTLDRVRDAGGKHAFGERAGVGCFQPLNSVFRILAFQLFRICLLNHGWTRMDTDFLTTKYTKDTKAKAETLKR
jgi:hypothetical protein